MKPNVITYGLGILLAVGLMSVRADAFDPAVQLSNIQGDVQVKLPGSSKFVPAEEGRAYAYGTIFQTGEGGTATAQLGNGNSCDLSSEATVKFTSQDSSNNYVVMSILEGQVDLKIAEGFDSTGGKLEILWRGGYVLTVTSGEYTIETAVENELRVLALTVKSGEGSLAGPDYEIPVISEGAGLSIAGNANLTFLRLRCFAGEFGIQVLDEALQPRLIEMNEGRVVKILRKISATADAVIATVMEIDENNNIVRADTYTIPREDSEDVRVLLESVFKKEVDGKNGPGSDEQDETPPSEPIVKLDEPEDEGPKTPGEPFEDPIPENLHLTPTDLDVSDPNPTEEKPLIYNPARFTPPGKI